MISKLSGIILFVMLTHLCDNVIFQCCQTSLLAVTTSLGAHFLPFLPGNEVNNLVFECTYDCECSNNLNSFSQEKQDEFSNGYEKSCLIDHKPICEKSFSKTIQDLILILNNQRENEKGIKCMEGEEKNWAIHNNIRDSRISHYQKILAEYRSFKDSQGVQALNSLI